MPKELEVTHKVLSVTFKIQKYKEQLDLDALGIATYNIILSLL